MSKPIFDYCETTDGYERVVGVIDNETGHVIGKITQSPGHCCAVSILGTLSPHGFWNDKKKVNSFIAEMKKMWTAERVFRANGSTVNLSLFSISGFHVYLSRETAAYDTALRTHPDIKLVHSFYNKRNAGGDSSYQGNQIDLYYMEF